MAFRLARHRTGGLFACAQQLLYDLGWYGHLRTLAASPWYIAAIASWSVALFEYLLQVPANRIGYTEMSLSQLKILQEVISLTVFLPFSIFIMKESFKWDYVWAALCIMGAVYFIFRSH